MNIIDVMEQVSSTLFLIIKNDKAYVFDSYRENDSSYDFGVYSVHPVEDLKNGKMSIDDIPDLYLNDYFDFLLHEDFEATYNVTSAEIWLLKRMEPVYRHYPWKSLLKSGTNGVATSEYGRELMHSMMMVYDGDQDRYAKISGHGFRILAEAMEADLPYKIKCPVLLICGEKDHAGSCIRYNKAWHKKTGIPIEWIKGAGHNSNTDAPETVNGLIEKLLFSV